MTSLQDYLNQKSTNTAVNEVILTIAEVGKTINHLLQRGAFADILGEAGNQNVQGEEQKKLDVIANDLLLEALTDCNHCAGVASEELDDATPANSEGDLLVLFDPLDGSSNIDINMAVGTIFSILPYQRQGQTATNADFLQKGDAQLAAGYLLYGPATMLAVSTGDGVAMFGYDPQQQEYLLIKDGVRIDEDTKEYAINGSNYRHWQQPMQQYVDEVIAGKSGVRGKDFNTRWVAAMVGDVHRILCRGGVFMYPFDSKDPNKAGKLRLMYEANPMSLLIEQAGGSSTTATQRIMDIEPNDIHQRVPVILGSKNEVEYIEQLHKNALKA
ncbi:class 1 fructose-bisphosphatase [Psychrobacter sp. I-STPA10]|uniref:class 1 fructose-bisphosphatase n=1 Tax=Psychrobacter sp. I-STPA10 TaxID=2585769 RepID=UPI001E469EFB|nr:class 1 fructose-bisphosphatase [Psychrobacter sp. I-STPA10]